MEIRRLPQGPGRNEHEQRTDDRTHAGAGPGEPVQLLSLRAGARGRSRSRHGVARRDSAYRAGMALLWRPRITAELRRQGWTVNPKRVHRLMREDNLLCVRKLKYVVTTDSNH